MICKALLLDKATVADADGGRVIKFVASSGNYDRVDDRLFPAGLKPLPDGGIPLLAFHDAWTFAPGNVRMLKAEGNFVLGEAWLPAMGVYRLADMICDLWGKTVKSVSVGFKGLVSQTNERKGRDYLEWECLEVSVCNIPMNPDAIARGILKPDDELKWSVTSGSSFEDERLKALIERVAALEDEIKNFAKPTISRGGVSLKL
jgi:hypothetical protein